MFGIPTDTDHSLFLKRIFGSAEISISSNRLERDEAAKRKNIFDVL